MIGYVHQSLPRGYLPHPRAHLRLDTGGSIFRPRTRSLTATLVVYEDHYTPPVLPDDPPSPTWWPLEESMVARGSHLPIYTFASQFAGEQESALFDGDGRDDYQSREVPSPEQVADVDFLRGLNLHELMVLGACDAPLWRVMVSPAAADGKRPRYDENNLPTPATLVADLKATANFKSAITDMDDGGPLPYLRPPFPFADEIHEDDDKQAIFETFDLLEYNVEGMESKVVDPATDERGLETDLHCIENTLQNLAQLAALKQYVLKQRVFFVVLHTERIKVNTFGHVSSSHVLLLALGVSPFTGNLVGVVAMQLERGCM